MEIDGIGKLLFVAKTSAANLDYLYSADEAFYWPIADFQTMAFRMRQRWALMVLVTQVFSVLSCSACLEVLLLFARDVPGVVEPVIFATLEVFSASRHQTFVLFATYLIDGFTELLGDMKFVKTIFSAASGKPSKIA